jgi:HD superfamily phosphodiesterase
MDQKYRTILDMALPFLDTRDNLEHTLEAFDFALKLLQAEGGDPDVVLPAIILHDVGWKSIPEDLQVTAFGPGEKDGDLNKVHEKEGVRIAVDILTKVNYPPHLIEEIAEIISGHDSRKEAISKNDAIVKDSDKLWRYSEHAVGVNSRRFEMTRRQNVDRLKRKLDEWFLTETGKSTALEQLRLRELNTESN